MNFLNLWLKSALGTACGVALYAIVTTLLVFGSVPIAAIAVNSLVAGAIFGLVYSAVHIRRAPTFLTSFTAGLGMVILLTVLSVMAGTFAGWSIASVVGIVVFALVLGTGAFAGTRFGSRA